MLTVPLRCPYCARIWQADLPPDLIPNAAVEIAAEVAAHFRGAHPNVPGIEEEALVMERWALSLKDRIR